MAPLPPFRLSDVLINTDLPLAKRREAAKELAAVGHYRCLPALLAVARDRSDDLKLREQCVRYLAGLNSRRVVDALIDLLVDEKVGRAAWIELRAITGVGFRGEWDADPESKAAKARVENWRRWWDKGAAKVKLDHTRAGAKEPPEIKILD